MKRWLYLLPLLLLGACQSPDDFLDRCAGMEFEVSEYQSCRDLLGHYSLPKPALWAGPFTENNQDGNQLILQDTARKVLLLISEFEKAPDYKGWEQELAQIQAEFDVRDQGETQVGEQPAHWCLMYDAPPEGQSSWSFFVSFDHPSDNRTYTATVRAPGRRSINERLCEVAPLLEGFKFLP